ncbi:MAG: DUF4392 domain-containing protein [Desulfobacteraceae bacterium]|nr:DUF4392 domain-containing protein [Desulfobacteraceae bacterium]
MNHAKPEENNMKTIAAHIERSIQQDPGNRGLDNWAIQKELLPATQSLAQGDHIIITTGFYILSAGVIETDGPPGAIILADALRRMGKKVTLLIDSSDATIIRRGMDAIGSSVRIVEIHDGREISAGELFTPDTTHFIALERPGQAEDGCYYNFRGYDLSPHIAPLDDLFVHAQSRNIMTIGIGDGGNELGLGKVSANVDSHMPDNRPFSCKTAADFCICAGVSNWGGYGMAALLSVMASQNLLPSPPELSKLLDAITEAGAVDGVTGKNTPSVDGLEEEWEHNIFFMMHELSQSSTSPDAGTSPRLHAPATPYTPNQGDNTDD